VKKIEARLDGLKVNLPPEPMIVGAVGAALFALDGAQRKASPALTEQVAG
jgi:activator of 2-hydroxyglutaryl-CoA dehydratase